MIIPCSGRPAIQSGRTIGFSAVAQVAADGAARAAIEMMNLYADPITNTGPFCVNAEPA